MTMKAGEYKIKAGDMALNANRCVQTIAVINTGDRPIQIGSHYHFFEVNHVPIDKNIATSLLTGIITDTDNFTNSARSKNSEIVQDS